MTTLSLPSDYLARLIAKMRGIQAREGEVDVDTGSNATDDRMIDALQDSPGDLSRDEVRQEIRGLNERQQAELVALLWTGRGDAEPESWEETVQMARDRRDTPTERYLLGQPLAAEHWEEGAERLGIELGSENVVAADDIRTR
jgi:Protein of unknown function (DUF3775)